MTLSVQSQIKEIEAEREKNIFLDAVCLILKYRGIREILPKDESRPYMTHPDFKALYEDDNFLISGVFSGLQPSYYDSHGLECVYRENVNDLEMFFRNEQVVSFDKDVFEDDVLKDVVKRDFSSSSLHEFNNLYLSVDVRETSQSFEEAGGMKKYPDLEIYKEFRKTTYNLGDNYLRTLNKTIEEIKFEAWKEGCLHLFGLKMLPMKSGNKHPSHGEDSLVVATAYRRTL